MSMGGKEPFSSVGPGSGKVWEAPVYAVPCMRLSLALGCAPRVPHSSSLSPEHSNSQPGLLPTSLFYPVHVAFGHAGQQEAMASRNLFNVPQHHIPKAKA